MTQYIIIGVLVAFSGILSYITYNLLRKVEKYEDITIDRLDTYKTYRTL